MTKNQIAVTWISTFLFFVIILFPPYVVETCDKTTALRITIGDDTTYMFPIEKQKIETSRQYSFIFVTKTGKTEIIRDWWLVRRSFDWKAWGLEAVGIGLIMMGLFHVFKRSG